MAHRAEPSGITLGQVDASLIKGMLARGDRQHDIAAWFGVNGGRIAEISSGTKYSWITPAVDEDLPPAGPYPCGKDTAAAIAALSQAKLALAAAKEVVKIYAKSM